MHENGLFFPSKLEKHALGNSTYDSQNADKAEELRSAVMNELTYVEFSFFTLNYW